ncbi:Rhodanese-related sulfurtransferase [Arthrobacter sp. ok909]|nr:Rhodanese-related sulfurtransferase [Arthrobacter sp. ok909]
MPAGNRRVLSFCSTSAPSYRKVQHMEITPQQLAEQLKSGSDAQIVDVRESAEVAEGMIPGARHIALGELGRRLGDLDKSRPVIAVCRSGRRSAVAADQLTAEGFTAYTVPGGMLDWTAAGFPTG